MDEIKAAGLKMMDTKWLMCEHLSELSVLPYE
jgi:hypothetical protein